MKILLDRSPRDIRIWSERWTFDFWQLRTPLTRRGVDPSIPYGLDNGCFSEFRRATWERMLEEAEDVRPIFVCLPDIVGDALRTLELFDQFKTMTAGLPRALVLQDGIGSHRIPWDDISAVFIGGSDCFKYSDEAVNAARTAKMLNKWVHVGRVNTPERVYAWKEWGDSIDGSGISRYDHMLQDVLHAIRGTHPQQRMLMGDLHA